MSRGRAGDWPGLAMWPLVTEAAASVHVTLVSASPGHTGGWQCLLSVTRPSSQPSGQGTSSAQATRDTHTLARHNTHCDPLRLLLPYIGDILVTTESGASASISDQASGLET